MVVVTEQEDAYNSLDLPLLNRFEKQVAKSFLYSFIHDSNDISIII